MLLWYLAQSFKKGKTKALLYTLNIFKKISTHIFGLKFFSEKSYRCCTVILQRGHARIESAQRHPTRQAFSATPSLNEVLIIRIMH